MAYDNSGYLKKDERRIRFKETLALDDLDVQLDLCSVIEHLGNQNFGHYLCGRRNFIMTKPFLSERDPSDSTFRYANWSLVSDEGIHISFKIV